MLNALSPLFPIAARRKLVGKNIYFFNSIIFKQVLFDFSLSV